MKFRHLERFYFYQCSKAQRYENGRPVEQARNISEYVLPSSIKRVLDMTHRVRGATSMPSKRKEEVQEAALNGNKHKLRRAGREAAYGRFEILDQKNFVFRIRPNVRQ